MTRPSAIDLDARYEGRWLRAIIDRPKANVLSSEVIDDLRALVTGLSASPHCRLLSIEGAGSHFSFGASVEEHLPNAIGHVLRNFHGLVAGLVDAPAVTVAIVRGQCLGGGFEVALACDLIFASEDALLGVPEIALGVFPPVAAALLPSRIGTARAARAILSGEAMPARYWERLGVVHAVVPKDGVEAAVDEWFEAHLASKSAAALRHASFVTRSDTRRLIHDLLPQIERRYLEDLMMTADAVEGIRAFLEKREPIWRDS
jgi:cyclohexa-1,5-dienecarbonyl-CoA hydratase